jgi:hypothetical protein
MRFLISAIVSIIRAGLGMQREVHSNWMIDHVPTKRELEKRVDDLVKEMISHGDSEQRTSPLVYDTYSFEITSIFRDK